MGRKIISPVGIPKPISFYSNGMLVGPTLYSAGQAALYDKEEVMGIGDASKQAVLAFFFLFQILKEGGMSFADVVRLNFFIKSREDIPALLAVKDEYLKGHRPALSFVVVEGVALEDFLFEVEFIAYKEETDSLITGTTRA